MRQKNDFDLETVNPDLTSICAIGFVYFKDGAVAQRLGTLIDPEDYFAPSNIAVHGIGGRRRRR